MWAPERAGGAPYHIVRATRLLGPLDEAALDRALVALERRHEALRTRFDVAGDEVLLRVGAARDTVLERCDEAADAAWSVDLTRQAPWRARLRGGPDAAGPQLFEVCAHHAAVDGRSFQRLVVELGTLYEAFAAGRPSPLPAVAWGARDFAAWQARCRERGRWDEQLSYWRRQLSGLERLRLPATTAAPAAAPHAAGMQRRPLDRGLAGRLAARARAEASTPFMATLAAYGAVLHRWSGQPDLAVGTPFGARPQGGAQGVVGMFVNRLALRLDLSGSPSLREVLRRTRDTVLRAFANADVPLEHVAGALDLPEGPEETPLFQAFFNQLDVSGFSLELPGVACTPLPAADRQVARFDLALYAVTDHRRQELVLVHDLERLGAAEAGSFLEDLVVALTALADSPRTAVGDLPSTTASQNLTGS